MTKEEINQLAKATARAQITAVDEYIAEETADWPKQYLIQIPQVTQASDDARLLAFRKAKVEADVFLQVEKRNNEIALQKVEESKQRDAERLKQQQLHAQYQRDLEKWDMEARHARATGQTVPPQPAPPKDLKSTPMGYSM